MRLALPITLIGSVALLGCGGDDEPETMLPPPPVEDSYFVGPDPLTGQTGSIVLGQSLTSLAWQDTILDGTFYAFGLSLPGNGGYVNMAHCILLGSPCVGAYPAEGETLAEPFDGTFLQTQPLDPGNVVAAGTSLAYQAQQGFSLGTPAALTGPGDLSISGGDLVDYMGTDVFEIVTGDFGAVTPDPSEQLRLTGNETVVITWTPGGTGTLTFGAGDTLIGLEDSGLAEISAGELGLEGPVTVTTAFLSRVANTEIDASGNTFHVETRIDQAFDVLYVDADVIEMEDGTNISDTCAAAAGLTPLVAATYWGTTENFTNTIDLPDGNATTGFNTAGFEGFARIDMVTGQELTVEYTQTATDATTFLLDANCAATPIAGVDATLDGELETFTYTATADGPVFLALDSWAPETNGVFSLVIGLSDVP